MKPSAWGAIIGLLFLGVGIGIYVHWAIGLAIVGAILVAEEFIRVIRYGPSQRSGPTRK